jgi:hypothetical protein
MMTDEVLIIPLADRERWQAEHRLDGRPSQAWDYAQAIAREGAEPSLAVIRSGQARLMFCFVERAWRGNLDVVTPLGLSGASESRASRAPWDLWREYAIDRAWVAGYIQLADDVELESVHEQDRIVSGNSVFLLDLQQGDPLAGASEIIRRKIRRAIRSGVSAVTDSALLAEALARLYPTTMLRIGAGPAYRHNERTLRALAQLPGAVVAGAAIDGVVEAVSVFAVAGDRAEFLCNGCSERGREFSAWLIAQAIESLRMRGVRELNLGGGVVPGDGLYEFKARFHGRPRTLRSLRQVYAAERYRQLCMESGVDPEAAWFPAYRLAEADADSALD